MTSGLLPSFLPLGLAPAGSAPDAGASFVLDFETSADAKCSVLRGRWRLRPSLSLFVAAGLVNTFSAYGPLTVEWPGKDGKHPRCPPKGNVAKGKVNG